MKMKILVALSSSSSLADVEVALEALAKKKKLTLELGVTVDGQLAYNMFMSDRSSNEGKAKDVSSYDLLIIDLDLPTISGCVLARTIKKVQNGAHGPPIVLYTNSTPEPESRCKINKYVDAQVVREGSDTTVLIETVSKLVQH
jgi:CheY-like chemotaxis protein